MEIKSVYSLTDTSLIWFKRVTRVFIKNGGKSVPDPDLLM